VAPDYETITPAEPFASNCLHHLDFTSVFQLAAESESGLLDAADRILLVPDLIAYWLTGTARTEATNASTTGLLGLDRRTWDRQLLELAGTDRCQLAELVEPGQTIGELTASATQRLGADRPVKVTAVGSHDTASAVVAVPFASKHSA